MNAYVKGQTIDFKFPTRNASGPASLSSGAISIYRGNSTTEFTTGVTLTADFDGKTGQNHVRIVTTDAAYAPGADFEAVISAGTVGGISVVGETVFRFRLLAATAVWFDKAGDDSNDGLTLETAKLTPTAAVTTANSQARAQQIIGGGGEFDIGYSRLDLSGVSGRGHHLRSLLPRATKITSMANLAAPSGWTLNATPGPVVKPGTGSRVEGLEVYPAASELKSILAITRSGTTATCIMNANHGYQVGWKVTITGSSTAAFNAEWTITGVAEPNFTFTCAGTETAPAAGGNAYLSVFVAAFGMNSSFDTNYDHAEFIDCIVDAPRASDIFYSNSFTGTQHLNTIRGGRFRAGWDVFYCQWNWNTMTIDGVTAISTGSSPADPTIGRVAQIPSSGNMIIRDSEFRASGGTTTNSTINNTGTLSLTNVVLSSSGTGAADLINSGTTRVTSGTLIDRAKVTNSGTMVYEQADIGFLDGDEDAAAGLATAGGAYSDFGEFNAKITDAEAGIITTIQSGLATAAALQVVDDLIDTEVGAIKAKTDQLTFTVAGQVDANTVAADESAIAAAVWANAFRTLTGPPAITSSGIRSDAREIVKGNDYDSTSQPILVPLPDGPTDLSEYTWTFTLSKDDDNANSGASSITGTVGIDTATGAGRQVRIDLTATNTATLAKGLYNGALRGTKTSNSKKWTPYFVAMTVLTDPNQA